MIVKLSFSIRSIVPGTYPGTSWAENWSGFSNQQGNVGDYGAQFFLRALGSRSSEDQILGHSKVGCSWASP
jgi:hypothetical protein